MRIYTCMGKENVRDIEAFILTDKHVLKIYDNNEVESIKYIISTGQPCCVQIYYTDSNVNIECKLNGCICDDNEIYYKTASLIT